MPLRWPPTLALLMACFACGGDERWAHPSPALDLPAGFDRELRSQPKGRLTFPDRAVGASIVWEFHRGGDVSQILMRRHPGSTRPEDVWASVNQIRTNNQSWTVEGPTSRQVAGRPAWEWWASVPSLEGGTWASQRTLVVAYPDSTWVSSFWGQHPEWHDQARMDAVLSSFRIPVPARPVPKTPLIVVGVLLLTGAVVGLKTRKKPAPARPMPSREPVHSARANLLQQQAGSDPTVGRPTGPPGSG
ncbi:MAG: hypothetical protein OEO23_11805 [Gemmatimonadota bacterium]|nr:hypothetical protein [Gemmatimonadota bacterium]